MKEVCIAVVCIAFLFFSAFGIWSDGVNKREAMKICVENGGSYSSTWGGQCSK